MTGINGTVTVKALRSSGYGSFWLEWSDGVHTTVQADAARQLIREGKVKHAHHHGPHDVWVPVAQLQAEHGAVCDACQGGGCDECKPVNEPVQPDARDETEGERLARWHELNQAHDLEMARR